jgi:hypothetical protein
VEVVLIGRAAKPTICTHPRSPHDTPALLFTLIDGEETRRRHTVRPTEIVARESARFA